VARLINNGRCTLTRATSASREASGPSDSAENPAKQLWFTRDHLAMARALGLGKGGRKFRRFYSHLSIRCPLAASRNPARSEVQSQVRSFAIRPSTWFARPVR